MKVKRKNKTHYRDCKSKKRFYSYNDALKCGKKYGINDCYYCSYCDGYHLTSQEFVYDYNFKEIKKYVKK